MSVPPRLRQKETTLSAKSSEAREVRARAELSIKKEERARDGAKAMMEYLANSQMVRERTERLRALRLAKEAAERDAQRNGKAETAPAPAKVTKRKARGI
jgi:hypothetical protein